MDCYMEFKLTLFILISILLLYSCYTDIMYRRIMNITTLLVMLLSLVLGSLNNDGLSFLTALSILIIGFLLSILRVIGAGDVKIASALVLGLTNSESFDFLLLTAFVGIPVSVITLVFYKKSSHNKRATVPYGLAIAGGYWLQFFL